MLVFIFRLRPSSPKESDVMEPYKAARSFSLTGCDAPDLLPPISKNALRISPLSFF